MPQICRYAIRSGFEIARAVDLGDGPGLFRFPAQQRPGSLARGRDIDPREERKPARVVGRLFGGFGDEWQFQASADRAGDVFEGQPSSAIA